MVEQVTLNHRVGGSSPSPPTYDSKPENYPEKPQPFGSLNPFCLFTVKPGFIRTSQIQLVNIPFVALCLNPQCQKRVASKSSVCAYCGGTEISEFNSYTKSESLTDEISIENFHKVVKNTQPFIERTLISEGTKVSFRSKVIVRFQYLMRKTFRRR